MSHSTRSSGVGIAGSVRRADLFVLIPEYLPLGHSVVMTGNGDGNQGAVES